MSRKHRKALREEVYSYSYSKPMEEGGKMYMITYGSELLFIMEIDNWDTMTKAKALHWINEHFEDEGRPKVDNINKVNVFRVG